VAQLAWRLTINSPSADVCVVRAGEGQNSSGYAAVDVHKTFTTSHERNTTMTQRKQLVFVLVAALWVLCAFVVKDGYPVERGAS